MQYYNNSHCYQKTTPHRTEEEKNKLLFVSSLEMILNDNEIKSI